MNRELFKEYLFKELKRAIKRNDDLSIRVLLTRLNLLGFRVIKE